MAHTLHTAGKRSAMPAAALAEWLSSYTRSATFCLLAMLPATLTQANVYCPLHLAIARVHLY